jgi:hypothetical protein
MLRAGAEQTYIDMFGQMPPLPKAKFEFMEDIDTAFLGRVEELRAAAFLSPMFDQKTTQLMVFAALLSKVPGRPNGTPLRRGEQEQPGKNSLTSLNSSQRYKHSDPPTKAAPCFPSSAPQKQPSISLQRHHRASVEDLPDVPTQNSSTPYRWWPAEPAHWRPRVGSRRRPRSASRTGTAGGNPEHAVRVELGLPVYGVRSGYWALSPSGFKVGLLHCSGSFDLVEGVDPGEGGVGVPEFEAVVVCGSAGEYGTEECGFGVGYGDDRDTDVGSDECLAGFGRRDDGGVV